MLKDLITKTRSYRSFDQKRITKEDLEKILEVTRLSSSARNSQTLRYISITNKEVCDKIFPLTAWAGMIPWNPTVEESPTGYILILAENSSPLDQLSLGIDIGIVSQNMMLMANNLGYGGCMIGAFNKNEVGKILNVDFDKYSVKLLLAFGKAKEKVEILEGKEGNLAYSRDVENYIQFVPKLPISKLCLKNFD